jgi:hypothetical protein
MLYKIFFLLIFNSKKMKQINALYVCTWASMVIKHETCLYLLGKTFYNSCMCTN